jgi:hypothetical protein
MSIKLKTTLNSYKDQLETEKFVAEGASGSGLAIIHVIPEGEEGRLEMNGPKIPGPWAFISTAPCVIDNYGGTARERRETRLKIPLDSVLEIEGLPGKYLLTGRDSRKLEGDGVKLIPIGEEATGIYAGPGLAEKIRIAREGARAAREAERAAEAAR